MKTIGLIGGTSPKSTISYYDKINDFVNCSLGRHHSAKIMMVSVDFEEIVSAIFSNQWNIVFSIVKEAALILQAAGVDILALCSNTLHKVCHPLKECIDIPILHILDPVIEVIKQEKINRVAILGTIYTMEEDFHSSYLKNYCDINLFVPSSTEKNIINSIIFNSLCRGISTEKNVDDIFKIVDKLVNDRNIDAVLLGCTELSFLFEKINLSTRVIDTTYWHSKALSNIATKLVSNLIRE